MSFVCEDLSEERCSRDLSEERCSRHLPSHRDKISWVYLGVRTCEVFLCFVAIVRLASITLTSLFSLFYVTGEFHRFLHRGRAGDFLI